MEPSKKVDVQTSDKIKEGTLSENPLYNSAVAAVQAGLAATAKKYAEVDNENARKDPKRGTIPYDNDKSIHYV